MASRAMRGAVRGARRFGEELIADPPEEVTQDLTAELAEERRKVMRIARRQYAAQLLPWKILAAAAAAGVFVDGQDWSPWAMIPWTIAIAIVSFVFTEWRLGGRHLKKGHIDWGNPNGRKQRRIRQRAVRSACMGACVGLWLVAVTVTDPGQLAGKLVWLAGAAVWASFSYHGWWQPAESAWGLPEVAPLPIHEQDDEDDDPTPVTPAAPAVFSAPPRARRGGVPVPAGRAPRTAAQATAVAQPAGVPAGTVAQPVARPVAVQVPDISMLKTTATSSRIPDDENRSAAIQKVLDDHHLEAKVVEAIRASAITRYGIEPGAGQQVSKILARKADFALACGSQHILMQTPIEGRTLIGIEVPNKERTWVTLGEVLASREAQRNPDPMLAAIGKDHDGEHLLASIRKMPHALLAGETGGGKSGGIDSIIMSILTRATPDEVQFLLVDVKRVDLTRYEGIPHLVMPVVTKAERAADALQWVITEMDQRYDEMERATRAAAQRGEPGVKHIDRLNEMIINGTHAAPPGANYVMRPFPYLLVVVDELADLLMIDESEQVEDAIVRLAQLARACGIHLVLATQNPLSEVLTTKIKANIPCRIAYRTQNHRSSIVILDEPGAEKLLGKGDCIVKLSGSHSVRVQGCLADEQEVASVVQYWRDEALKKGIRVPQIKLATTVRDDKPVQGRVTAYDSVLAAAVRLADHDGRVTKDQVRSATPGLSEAARNQALTRLFEDEVLGKVAGHQALYAVLRTSKDEPLEKEEDPQ